MPGFTYRGIGCCANSEGKYYGYVSVNGGSTVDDCAQACQSGYSSDPSFVGINFHPDFYGSTNCNCMLDTDGNGAITDTDPVRCPQELCYSYDEVRHLICFDCP